MKKPRHTARALSPAAYALLQKRFLYGADKGLIQRLQMIVVHNQGIFFHHFGSRCGYYGLGQLVLGAGDDNQFIVSLPKHIQLGIYRKGKVLYSSFIMELTGQKQGDFYKIVSNRM